MEKWLLVGSCLVALVMIGWNIKTLSTLCSSEIKIIGSVLLSFTSLRYLTLILYAYSMDLKLLVSIRYFYYASSIGITMLTAIAVWYVIPVIQEQIQLKSYLLAFLPWDVFYIYLILKQPTKLVASSSYGYELLLLPPFTRYLSIAQGSFILIMLILCLIGIIKYKHLQIRVQLFVIFLAQILLTIDGIASGNETVRIFKLFTVTEAFALWTIFYAFTHAIKRSKGNVNRSLHME